MVRMLVVHVQVHVDPDRVPEFLAATQANARASLDEPGVLDEVLRPGSRGPSAGSDGD